MLGCFNQILGQIWTNPNVGLKIELKNVTQWLGLSIFDPKLDYMYTLKIVLIQLWIKYGQTQPLGYIF